MDKHLVSSFKFIDYKFSEANLLLNENYDESESVDNESLEIGVGINIKLDDTNERAVIDLNFRVFEEDKENKYPYSIRVNMVGFFEIEGCKTNEDAVSFCKLNGTAIMFPYIRSAITDLTKISNVQPLILPAINIYRLIEENESSK